MNSISTKALISIPVAMKRILGLRPVANLRHMPEDDLKQQQLAAIQKQVVTTSIREVHPEDHLLAIARPQEVSQTRR